MFLLAILFSREQKLKIKFKIKSKQKNNNKINNTKQRTWNGFETPWLQLQSLDANECSLSRESRLFVSRAWSQSLSWTWSWSRVYRNNNFIALTYVPITRLNNMDTLHIYISVSSVYYDASILSCCSRVWPIFDYVFVSLFIILIT